MFEDPSMPLPDRKTLWKLVGKARAKEPFTDEDYGWLFNILATLDHDASYKLKERMKRYAAEENDESDV